MPVTQRHDKFMAKRGESYVRIYDGRALPKAVSICL